MPESEPSIEAVIDDAAQRCGVTRDEVIVSDVTPTIWPDSGLGVRNPGYAYAQVITPGSVVQVIVGDRRLTYHTSARTDHFVYVEAPE